MCGRMWLDIMKVTVDCPPGRVAWTSHGGSVRDLLEAIPDARARSTSETGARMRQGSDAGESLGQPSPSRLDYLDQRIVAALQANARATWRQIAAVVGSSESTVKRRAERLVQSGTIRITVFTEPVSPGFPVLVQCTCKIGGGPAGGRRPAGGGGGR